MIADDIPAISNAAALHLLGDSHDFGISKNDCGKPSNFDDIFFTNVSSSFESTNEDNNGKTCSSHKCGNNDSSHDLITISAKVVLPLLQKKEEK